MVHALPRGINCSAAATAEKGEQEETNEGEEEEENAREEEEKKALIYHRDRESGA